MKTTTNYLLKKIELADSPPDITVLNANWDAIDTALKAGVDANNATQKFKLTADTGMVLSLATNLNSNKTPGIYSFNPATTNTPEASVYGIVKVWKYDASLIFQEVIIHKYSKTYLRSSSDGGTTWTGWRGFAGTEDAQMFKLTSDEGMSKSLVANMNSTLETGLYAIKPATLNRPSNLYYGALEVSKRALNDVTQRVISTATGTTYTRVSVDNGATWTAWKELADANNAIVESGVNASGRYVKFGDGTLICYGKFAFTSDSGGIREIARNYPASFTASPSLNVQFEAGASGQYAGSIGTRYVYGGSFNVVAYAMAANTEYLANYVAVGRWV